MRTLTKETVDDIVIVVERMLKRIAGFDFPFLFFPVSLFLKFSPARQPPLKWWRSSTWRLPSSVFGNKFFSVGRVMFSLNVDFCDW